MAENYDLSDLGASAVDLSDLGGTPSGGGPAEAPREVGMRDLAIMLAREIFGGVKKADASGVLQGGADVISQPVEAAKGLVSGAKRNEFDTSQTFSNQFGQAVGRYGPAVAAGMAASAAAPAVVPAALASAVGPTIAGMTTGAALSGVGATGGDLASMGISKAIGGNAPETVGEAVKEASKTGLETAAIELGLGATIQAAKLAAPTVFQVMSKIAAPSVKRAINKPEIVDIGPGAQTRVEFKAAKALRETQQAVEKVRQAKGAAVDKALKEFHEATNGQPIISGLDAATRAKQVLEDAIQGSAAVEEAIPKSERVQILKIIKEIEKAPQMTAMQAVRLRQAIDDLTAFRRGGVPPVSSKAGQRAMRELGAGLRESIAEAAQKAEYPWMLEANKSFSDFAQKYDEIAALIGTKELTDAALIKQMRRLANQFNAGGAETQILQGVADSVPETAGPMNKLLDLIAARELTKLPKSTPSSLVKDAFLLLTAPQAVGAGIKVGAKAGKAAKFAGRVSAANQTIGQRLEQ